MDLRDLLTDLRVYLGETLAQEKLSTGAESKRLRLLALLHNRHKSPSPPAYLDMSRNYLLGSPKKTTHGEQDGKSNGGNSGASCYEPVKLPDVIERSGTCRSVSGSGSGSGSVSGSWGQGTITTGQWGGTQNGGGTMSQYAVPLSASALRFCAVHSGNLSRRTKLLFIEQLRRSWAALSNKSLFLYGSDTDSKPVARIDLTGYQARPLSPNTKKDYTFELICPGNKTYQFVAGNLKDMETWVEAVNLACKEDESPREEIIRVLPLVPPQEMYDTPDSRIRPVLPTDYESMKHQDSLYQVIGVPQSPVSKPQEQIYKNVGGADECMYYNVVPAKDFIMEETIYQTINEEKPCGMMMNSVHQMRDQLYEPVSSGNDDSRASR